jgi:hypothetical protein
MKKLATLVMPYYMNPTMLDAHYAEWARYSKYICDRLEVVIVDDGSPTGAAAGVAIPPDVDVSVSIYRVKDDIPWNQHGARNLGAHVATTKWLIMTDMDHMIRGEDMTRLLMKLETCKTEEVFTFARVDAPDRVPTRRPDGSLKPHVNSFALWRKTYWAIGGYDEDFCGMYGTDSLFRARLFAKHPAQHLKNVSLERYAREVIADASTTTLERRAEAGTTKSATKERRKWKEAQGRTHIIKTLDFSWEHVLTSGPSRLSVGSGANLDTESGTQPSTSTSSEPWSNDTTSTSTDLSASQTTPAD